MTENQQILMNVRMRANAVAFWLFRDCEALWKGREVDTASLPKYQLRELLLQLRDAVDEAADVERCQGILAEYQDFDGNLQRRNPDLERILSSSGHENADVSFVYEPSKLLSVIAACAESQAERIGASRVKPRIVPVQAG